ncbi:uncharacterized protein LOC122505914 [Leptopilina heterotoma]|uniref:uncharacterized protein LOC122505914 n=1 Tax=Leptopilina heterotoma TaxID=63436 RepID=UPI001CA8B58E|nr:uncharacterized protein LOC122505914 [Leptopilina heterotoma]
MNLSHSQEQCLSPPLISEEELTEAESNKPITLNNFPPSKKFKCTPDLEKASTPSTTKIYDLNENNISGTLEPPVLEPSQSSPICDKLQQTDLGKERLLIKHDHGYENSPKTTKRKLLRQQRTIKILKQNSRVQKQHILRLKKRITSLKDILLNILTTGRVTLEEI